VRADRFSVEFEAASLKVWSWASLIVSCVMIVSCVILLGK